ncbi:MAG: choice-of-anchor D domain-containing protein [bacterium]|nr:choice-of-anchor D domain-containing protein [bacterium]
MMQAKIIDGMLRPRSRFLSLLLLVIVVSTSYSENYSLQFGGNGYVSTPSTGIPFGANPRTVELWFKTNVVPATNTSLFTQGANVTGGMFNLRITNPGYPSFCGWSRDFSGNIVVTDNQWHHFAMTYSNSMVQLYIDGELNASANYTLNTSSSISQLRIGCMYTTAPQYEYFNGKIDEVRFWNVALTQVQIQANMRSRLNGTEANLVGYWRLDEGVGTTTADASGHGLTGTLASPTWSTDVPFFYSALSVRPTSINFDTVTVGNTVRDSVWVINRDPVARTLTLCRITRTQYSLPIDIPYTIPSMDSVAIPILFAPDTIGSFNDSLRLQFDNEVAFRIPVQGSGAGTVLTLLEPIPPDTLWLGYTVPIRWLASGITGVVWVEVNRSYPTGEWEMLSGIMNASVRQYLWIVNGEASDSVRFRVTSASSGLTTITSGNLSIRRKSLTLLDHHGTVPLFIGSLDTIRWSHCGAGATIGIAIARNGIGGEYESLSDSIPTEQGYFPWTVTGPTTTEARFVLYSVTYTELVDTSESAVTISSALLEYSPNAIAFGDTRIHSARNQIITFHNRSSVPIAMQGVTGGVANGFGRSWLNLPPDNMIPAGDSVQLNVQFVPDTMGLFRDTIRVGFQLPFPTAMIPVSGFGYGCYAELSDSILYFGNVLEPTRIDSMKTWLKCIGGNRALTDVRFLLTNPAYSIYPFDLSDIAVGDSAQFTVYFQPNTVGTYSGRVLITSNAVNYDTMRVYLTGFSEYYPATPSNLDISINGENALLQWDRVDTSISGAPITVDRYIVFFRSVGNGPWYYLGSTLGANTLTFQHDRVVRHSPAMYYEIRAWLDHENDSDFWNTLPMGTRIDEDVMFRRIR